MESKWIWPFELLDKLGEGGMGVVYRARYVGNDRHVAVKLLPEDVNANATVLARFERELEVLKQLRHPNIVHCFGGRCESDQRYYAMELVAGGTLADHLAEHGQFAWENVVDFAIQMCNALQHAHEHGVIHRDVKPRNFLLTKSGQLKLSDFGIAAVVAEGRLTAAGRTVGTTLYMAPEQIRGGSLDHRADLYALGCVIHEMLTGDTPFNGSSPAEILLHHLKDAPPHVARTVLNCPLELDSLIIELLSKDPTKRPNSAEEVASRLNAILLPAQRERVAEPALFTKNNRTVVKTPVARTVKNSVSTGDSEFDVGQVRPKFNPRDYAPWAVAAVTLLACGQLWFNWSKTASQLRRAEETWVTLLETGDAQSQVLATRGLKEFDWLSPLTIVKLSNAAASRTADVKLGAIAALTKHAVESRPVAGEMMRIQKVDDSPEVRSQAGLAVTAIQQTFSPYSRHSYTFWSVLLATVSGLCSAAWWIWKTVAPYAH